jgi:hypothetical protein
MGRAFVAADAGKQDSLPVPGGGEGSGVVEGQFCDEAAERRETPAIDPETWAALEAQQTAQIEAARGEAPARLAPVIDAEIAGYGVGPQPGPEPGARERAGPRRGPGRARGGRR